MAISVPEPRLLTSIIDNRGENTLLQAICDIAGQGRELWIASAYFSLDALNVVGVHLQDFDRVRILFGSDANRSQRRALLNAMRALSDTDLAKQRDQDPQLEWLRHASLLVESGRFEARCYTRDKFHAKAYLAIKQGFPPLAGIVGSGNFTRPGLTQNIELNVHLGHDQAQQLKDWFDERWKEAELDIVTNDIYKEIERQVKLYDPYILYQKALLVWGKHYQGDIRGEEDLAIKSKLDPHQLLGYTRALEIIDREHGVMICDGVGLGKSFIALALMEHYCARKKNVLVIAPKSIMDTSWEAYLKQFLDDYRQPFGTIFEMTMSDLGFDAEEDSFLNDRQVKRIRDLEKLIDRVDVIVVDESHNFRTTNTQRYINLRKLVQSTTLQLDKRKKVILLTATPINTKYQDLSAQLALISQETGTVAGYETAQVNSAAKLADKESPREETQLNFDFETTKEEHEKLLHRVLEAVVIQRKRNTCIELANAVGKKLVFPIRQKPEVIEYELSEQWKDVVKLAHKRFAPTAAFLEMMKKEYRKAERMKVPLKPARVPQKSDGIKFAAFLPEQYRIAGDQVKRSYQVEIFLAGLVFTNTMKQLESSPAAFQGILQSLGLSLVARLKFVCGDAANADIQPHSEWIDTPINSLATNEGFDDLESGENTELNGQELDEWLERAIGARNLHKKLSSFDTASFAVDRWRTDILRDLKFLREIHQATIEARRFTDFKLQKVQMHLSEQLSQGHRTVVFTQSQRTSFYLEKALQLAFPSAGIARIDASVKQETRADILYAFCPKYNARPNVIHRKRVDILICTDVLSEGVNMQEAECILNYDIHWNPVRLIQRIGRVDRRLDPEKSPVPHSFQILNCLPPDEINDIIKLVDTVEGRTTQISKTLGIDQAFFKATDPAGTLKEFNKIVDGEPSLTDRANEAYISALATPDPETMAAIAELPVGAFGVWEGAPVEGHFALFEMVADAKASEADHRAFRSIIGMPMVALEANGKVKLDAASVLEVLAKTVKGQPSGTPGPTQLTRDALKRMRHFVHQSFRTVNLPSTIQPRLICTMELRKSR